MREYTIKTETTVTDQLIADAVSTAFEGGITHWCGEAVAVERDNHGEWQIATTALFNSLIGENSGPLYSIPEFWDNDKRGYRLTNDQGDEIKKVLTLSAIRNALQYQPPNQKGISNNWFRKIVDRTVSEDYDADDADILVQIAVFNELVYG